MHILIRQDVRESDNDTLELQVRNLTQNKEKKETLFTRMHLH